MQENGQRTEEEQLLDISLDGFDMGQEEDQDDTVLQKKKKGNKKLLFGLIGGAILLLAGIGVLVAMLQPDAKAIVKVQKAETSDISETMDTSGTVTSNQSKTYYSPVNAPINSKTWKVGSTVQAGEVLISFDTTDLEKDNQKSQLTSDSTLYTNSDAVSKDAESSTKLANAQSAIDRIQSQIDSANQYIADLNVEIANRQNEISAATATLQNELIILQNDQAQISADVTQMQSDQQEAQLAGLEYDSTDLVARQQDLINKNTEIVNKQIEINNAGAAANDPTVVAYNLEITNTQNELTDLQTQLSEAQADKTEAKANDLTEAGRASLDANSNLAELEASTTEELLAKGKAGIKADFNGIITDADAAQNGATATQGLKLITVASVDDVSVDITVSKNDYDKIKEGQKATITIGDYEYKGTVDNVGKVATMNEKGNTILNASVKIDNPDENIILGVEAKVKVEVASAVDTVVVPADTVNTNVDGDFMYVVEDGYVVERTVETGVRSDTEVEIVSGLTQGDQVIAKLPANVKVGDAVNPIVSDDTEQDQNAAGTEQQE